MSAPLSRSEILGDALLGWLVSSEPLVESAAAPRVLVVLAHPDDEIVGAASRLPRLRGARFIYITDGAPRDGRDARALGFDGIEAYARARRAESMEVARRVGIPAEQYIFLDLPDKEAFLHLPALARRLAQGIAEYQPEIILTHPYEGGHPDHDAAAFAVRAAVAGHAGPRFVPEVIEFTSYHRWNGARRFGEFLPDPRSPVHQVTLTPDERAEKGALIDLYESQRAVLQEVLLASESFRTAPQYDFAQPPHPGRLLYETFRWGISGADWRKRAKQAAEELGAAPVNPAASGTA